jgi:hypothetical protein
MAAACEKVIVADDGTVSLITLMDAIQIGIPYGGEPPPRGTLIPHSWAAFALWYRRDADLEEAFRQRVTVASEDGEELFAIETDFKMPQGINRLRLSQPVFGFPAWRVGRCDVTFSLRDDTASTVRWRLLLTYPVTVTHVLETEPRPTVSSHSSAVPAS